MKAAKHKKLEAIMGRLEGIANDLETWQTAEQERFDNMSERGQEGEKGEQAQGNTDQLQTAIDALDSAKQSIEEALGACQKVS